MFGVKRWIRFFFGFSKTETNGFIILLLFMAIVILSEPVSRMLINNQTDNLSEEIAFLDSLALQWQLPHTVNNSVVINNNKVKSIHLFAFDPNQASAENLKTLGFSKSVASRIINYRQKGGRFNTKTDLLKIYDIDSTLYRNLFPYIKLPVENRNHYLKFATPGNRTEKVKKKNIKFDINLADTTQLKTVYGIGSVLAARIVKYRTNLGGFINIFQIKEIYGLDSIAANNLIKTSYLENNFQAHQININTASELILDNHPYINKALAKAIVAYRFQHGNFNQVEDIWNLQLMKKEIADKIIPYLKVED